MTESENFDLLNSPLEGTNLIEASAGTGKTYTITGLFLRLVLEKNLSVKEIVVVTFTEAATGELKDRIRKRLREAVWVFSGGQSEDAFLREMLERHKDSKTAVRTLREALRSFDQAAIYTIHGFCGRMLHENAFESGSLFDTELVTDQENIKREVVYDFWRRHFYMASPLFVNYAMNNKCSPDSLISLIATRTGQPYLKIIPQYEIPDSSQYEKAFKESFNEVSNAWPSARAGVEKILNTHGYLNRNMYRKANIPKWIRGMDHFITSGGNNPVLFKGFEKFTSKEIERSIKKNHAPPTHTFFEQCESLKQRHEDLQRIFRQRLLGLKAKLFDFVQDELLKKKAEKNIQFFDDLLIKVYSALKEKSGKELARAIRRTFRAALIDEFQDTDPVQYAIFSEVFGQGKSILFLIGDPKQAIYGFRGADIFTYMEAQRDARSIYTLRENWRSDPDLITAINIIFKNSAHPFVYDEIPFQPAVPALKKAHEYLRISEQSEPPLQLWFLDAGKLTGRGKAIKKAEARELISGAVATEISRLLVLGRNNRAILGERSLQEGDIAVLVRKNIEARLMQEALSALNIPSVLYSTGNLFDSHEALEMERVLAAIIQPDNEKLIKAALATDMMGVSGEELEGMMENETIWDKWLFKFNECHDIWNRRGFIRMFRDLILEGEILSRLMSLPDGERRSTNLLHLSEVLLRISIEKKLEMEGLLKWLSEQRDPGAPRLEEHQLRLEKDENAVKLVTIHKSKGLEYPILFCPFVWDGSKIKRSKDSLLFHDKQDNMKLTLDLGSEAMDQNRALAEKEQLAENLRLLYVALTRAKSRCYLAWGRFNESETSALAYLFHWIGSMEQEDLLKSIEKKFVDLSDKDMLKELQAISDKAGGTMSVSEIPLSLAEEYSPKQPRRVPLTCEKFSRNIDREWRISSFSSFTSGRSHSTEWADRDAWLLPHIHEKTDTLSLPSPLVPDPALGMAGNEEGMGIFNFPKGPKSGTLLHDILEHIDFAEKDALPVKSLIAGKIEAYGFESDWLDTIYDMITRLLSTPLDTKYEGLTLSRLENKDRLNELEFYFPLKKIYPETLNRIFTENNILQSLKEAPETMGSLQFTPTRGFMKGFIDLVFQWTGRYYIIDWKSNFLGNHIENYAREVLNAVMKEEYYILQYHIYTLALDQYLRLRLPGYSYENHFGGVYYIFLRGLDPEKGPGFGIYEDLPPPELVHTLREELIESGVEAKSAIACHE